MNLHEKIQRSKSDERIDYTKIGCRAVDEPMVAVAPSSKIIIKPIWEVTGDMEGALYAAYIAEHSAYNQVYVRQSLYDTLQVAAAALPEDYKLVVHAGHRPVEVQLAVLEQCKHDYLAEHPTATDQEALAHARTYVSDPAIKLPPHCCGAAVDVELYDVQADQYVDFGSQVNLDEDISYLHSEQVTATQKAQRMLLLQTMLSAGFASYYAEWWHFSYGDEIWAWFYGKSDCLYDIASLNV